MRAFSGWERLLLVLGLLLVSFYVGARIYSAVSSRAELNRFWQAQTVASRDGAVRTPPQGPGDPDFRLWSEQRIAAYKASLSNGSTPPEAVLKIPAINLEVPVLEGTDELALNRALGHIEGTALPGHDGNVGIAGHRDGFFRGLKDIHQGDAIELFTPNKSERYFVDEILIVSPEDVSVLQPRSKASLTLVTCYPFYFVGSAPQRFIVHATIGNPGGHEKEGPQRISTREGGGQKN